VLEGSLVSNSSLVPLPDFETPTGTHPLTDTSYYRISPLWFQGVPSVVVGAEYSTNAELDNHPQIGSEWLVRFTPEATAPLHSVADSAALLPAAPRFEVLHGLGLPGYVLVRTDEMDRARVTAALRGDRHVASFTPNRTLSGTQDEQTFPNEQQSQAQRFEQLFGLYNVGQFVRGLQTTPGADIDAPRAWAETTGSADVVVAVLDTGIDLDHEDLAQNLWDNAGEIADNHVDDDGNGFVDDKHGCDFVHGTYMSDGKYYCGIPDDDNSHGTHVSGIIAAVGNNALGITGVSWSSKVMALKVLNAAKFGDLDDIILALHYVELMRTRPVNPVNVVATNNSFIDELPGGAADGVGFRDDMFDAIERLDDANVLFVASAGNNAANLDDVPFFPASYSFYNQDGTDVLSNVITVGATDAHDGLWNRSNYGAATVDIAAPGVAILSTKPGNDYSFKGGTSMAAPYVSGVAALVASVAPGYATAAEIRNAILRGAETLPALRGVIAGAADGGRRLNAYQSLNVDTFSPRAQLLSVSPVVAADSPVDIAVEYRDDTAVVASSLNDFDLVIRRSGQPGPGRSVIRLDAGGSDGQTIRTTYRLLPPEPSWTVADNGVYEILVISDQVTDPAGNRVQPMAPTGTPDLLGTFTLNIVDESSELTVDRQDDGLGTGTLRGAIRFANSHAGADTIRLGAGTYQLSLSGTGEDAAASGDLDITNDLTIIGAGADSTVISGNELDRVFDIHPGATVTLQGLRVTAGRAGDAGGAIRNRGQLQLIGVALDGSSADADGGAIANLNGTLTLVQSLVSGNLAHQDGGGLYSTGTASVVNSTISGNWAQENGGAVYQAATGRLTLTNATVVNNSAFGSASEGGGVFNAGAEVSVANSILAQNVSTERLPTARRTMVPMSAPGTVVPDDSDITSWFWSAQDTAPRSAECSRWIVQLRTDHLPQATWVEMATELLNTPQLSFRVLRGLGVPGLFLVESLCGSAAETEAYLANHSQVVRFERDATLSGKRLPNDPELGLQQGLENRGQLNGTWDADIDASDAWDVSTGDRRNVVAVVDSGVDLTHPDLFMNIWINQGEIPGPLASNLIDVDADGIISFVDLNAAANAALVDDLNQNGVIDAADLLSDPRWSDGIDTESNGFVDDFFGWDFVDGDNVPFDLNGHGTSVAGTIAAVGNNGMGIAGINWESSLMVLRVLDERNAGHISDVVLATNYQLLMKRDFGANLRVSSNALGSYSYSPALREAIAMGQDILFVAAAGNGGFLGQGMDLEASPFFPASYDLNNILSVTATDGNDQLAGFANFGVTSVDVAGPGVEILSTSIGGGYGYSTGTSIAAAHASGIAALIAAVAPEATAVELRQVILDRADRLAGLAGKTVSSGRVNAFSSLIGDILGPRSQLDSAPHILEPGGTAQELIVTFHDDGGIDRTTLDDHDLRIVHNGVSLPVTMTAAVHLDGMTSVVTYRLAAPGGEWDASDNGEYAVELNPSAVFDNSGNSAPSLRLGAFLVDIPQAVTSSDVVGTFVSLGHNLIGFIGTAIGFGAAGDQMGTRADSPLDPVIGQLADNGGPTRTHLLLPSSPAIDAGDNAMAPAVDQRGSARPIDATGRGTAVADVGSVEVPVQTGSFGGHGFLDLNANAQRDLGEPALAGLELYLDANNDGLPSKGEVRRFVDADGTFRFDDLTAGRHRVIAKVPDGFTQTSPARESDYGVEIEPTSIRFAPMNSDTLLDVVVSSLVDDRIVILYQEPTGSFRRSDVDIRTGGVLGSGDFPTPTVYGTRSFVTGDFDGQEGTDIAVVNYLRNSVTVLLNGGDGTFTPVEYAVGFGPVNLVLGDYNGDGLLDLVATNALGDNLTVLLGNFGGRFMAPFSQAVGAQPISSVVTDFDLDGYVDLAVLTREAVEILYNDGTGQFRPAVSVPVGLNPEILVAPGDLNGDYFGDLVVANYGTGRDAGTVSVLLNGLGDGFSVRSFATSVGTSSISAGDFNGDGQRDLVATNSVEGDVSTLLNIGSGFFSPPINTFVGGELSSVDVADVNSDGLLDVTVSAYDTRAVSVLLGQGDGRFRRNVEGSALVTVRAGEHLTGVDFGLRLLPAEIQGVIFKDLDRDGIHDVDESGLPGWRVELYDLDTGGSQWTMTSPDNPLTEGVDESGTYLFTVFPYPPAGHYRVTQVAPSGWVQTVPATDAWEQQLAPGSRSSNIDFGNAQTGSVGGSSGDGYIEGFVYHDLIADGQRELAEPGLGDWTVYLDANNNGRKDDRERSRDTEAGYFAFDDLPPGKYRVRVDPQPLYRPTTPLALTFRETRVGAGDGPRDVVIADLDGQPGLDLAVVNGESNNVTILLNDGSRAFRFAGTVDVGFEPTAILTIDLDGQLGLDLIAANAESGDITFLLNDGEARFSEVASLPVGKRPVALAVADFDAKYGDDVAVVNLYSGSVSVLLRNATGSFDLPRSLSTAARGAVGYSLPVSIAAEDLDGDERVDLVVGNSSAIEDNVVVFWNNGHETLFDDPVPLTVGAGPAAIAVGDFYLDLDDQLDIAVANKRSNSVSVLRNSGHRRFAPARQLPVAFAPTGMVAADFDGDRALDLAVTDGSSNISFLRNGGGGRFDLEGKLAGTANFFYSFASSLRAADIDGDGLNDMVLVRGGDSSQVAIDYTELGFGSNVVVLAEDEASRMVLFGVQQVNLPPQLISIPPQYLTGTTVTVQLTGINAGGIDDLETDGGLEQQPLRITASSSRPDVLESIEVDYTSPGSRGELRMTRRTADADELVITVTVTDGGRDGKLETTDDNGSFQRSFPLSILPNVTPPAVTALTPASGAADVPSDAPLLVTFNEKIKKGAGTVVIKRSADGAVVQTIAVTDARVTVVDAQATIQLTTGLATSTSYYAQIDAGAFTDAAGNPCAAIGGATSWFFTTVLVAPTITLGASLAHLPEDANTTGRIKAADITVVDDGVGNNVLGLQGADAGLFEIAGSVLYLKAGAVLDYETNPVLDVTVAVDDAAVGGTPDSTSALAIQVTDANEPPTAVTLTAEMTTLSESTNTASRIKAADIAVADDALGSNMLSLLGADAGLFEIAGSVLYLTAGADLDYETNPVLDVTVAVDDPAVGGTPDAMSALVIQVTDVNEPPTVDLTSRVTALTEHTDLTHRLKIANVVVRDDALGAHLLSISGADAPSFEIDGTELFLRAGTALDWETAPTLTLTVGVDDPDLPPTPDDAEELTIFIVDVNEAPEVHLLNAVTMVVENTDVQNRLKVADVAVTDDGLGTNELALSGPDAELFEIVGTELFVKAGTALDYETQTRLEVTVAVSDAALPPVPNDTADLTITISDVNEPPVLAPIGDRSVAELTTLTFTVSATDPELPAHALTYSATGLPAGATFDADTCLFGWTPSEAQGPGRYEVTFVVSDGTTNDSETVTIAVGEVNAAPVLAPIGNQEVDEQTLLVLTVTAGDTNDVPANAVTLSVAGLPAGATFTPATGVFVWTPGKAQRGQYSVTFAVIDDGTPPLSDSEAVTIMVLGPTFQNPRHPCDVDDDGTIAPIDVLILINDINAHGSRELTTPPSPPPLLDPNGDGWITPLDVLIVVNYINARGSGPIPSAPGGEGEYDSLVDRVGRKSTTPCGVRDGATGLDSGMGSVLASTWPSRRQQGIWPGSLSPTPRTVSRVTPLRTVRDVLLSDGFEPSEWEEAFSAIAGEVARAWDSNPRR
jgi:subtilisin family serine protease